MMEGYNAFLEEWKTIKTVQKAILERLEAQDAENRRKVAKRTLWLSVGCLMVFMVIGILIGLIINTNAQIKSVPYAVSSETGCTALGGTWNIQKGNKFCFFVGK